MLRSIVGFSLQYRMAVLVVAAALMVFGAFRLNNMRVGVLPEFSPTIVEVQTEALGLSAVEVEDLVTVNMEELLAGTPWLKTMRSKSVPSLSSVLLVFEPGTDTMRARQVVSERLIGAHALPNVSKKPVMLQPLSTESRAMIVGLASKDVSLIDMSVVARWTVVPKLLGIPGVANVAIWGQRARQLQVQVDPARLREHGVTLNQVVKSTGEALWVSPLSYLEASMPGAGGWIDTPNQRLGIQHKQPITTASELAKVAVEGASVSLGEIARVVEEHPPLIGDAFVKGGPGLLLVIEKFPQANTDAAIRGVDAAMHDLGRGMPGIDVDTHVFRAASYAEAARGNLKPVGIAAALFLAIALLVLHSSWRGALISIAATAMSIMAALLVLYARGSAADMMVLGGLGLALAALIDDSVTAVENVLTRLREPREAGIRPAGAAIFQAMLQDRPLLAYATAAVFIALAPLFLIGESPGAFLSPLATSYMLALAASMAVAITLIPALSLFLLRNATPETRAASAPIRWLGRGHERALRGTLASPSAAVMIAAVAALAIVAVTPFLRWSLIPPLKETDVRVTWKAAPGISHPEMQRLVAQMTNDLGQVPGVHSVAAHIGRAITGDQVVGMESGQVWVRLHADAGYNSALAAIRERIQDYPGLDMRAGSYFTEKLSDLMTPSKDEIVVRVQGLERAKLRREAARVKELLASVPGLRNLRIDDEADAPEIHIEADLTAAGRVGLKPGDVRRAAATIFSGLEVGNLFEQQKVFDVVVWGTPENRTSLTNVNELLIDRPDGGHVRLADVAKVKIAPAPAMIEREGVSRYVDLRGDVAGRDFDTVQSDVTSRLRTATFPLEYHAAVLHDRQDRQTRFWRILLSSFMAAGMVYLLVQAALQSWRLASLFCGHVAAAVIGGIAGMLLAGGAVTLGSLAATIAVMGIAARHAIMFLGRAQAIAQADATLPADEIAARAARERLGPLAIGVGATLAALLPVIAAGNVAGFEILHPAALVLAAGIITSAAVTLLVAPALYISFATPRPAQQTVGGEQHAV